MTSESLAVRTSARTDLVDITRLVAAVVRKSGIDSGICFVYVPHTTAGVTINENADADVQRDLKNALDRLVPWEAGYAHSEGNSAAHLKASLTGFTAAVPVERGQMLLGTWQAVYFCEFDGPRERKAIVKVVTG